MNSLDVSDDLKQAFIEEAKKIKQEFSKQNGWAGLELVKVAVSKKGEPKFEWKKIAYSFDRNREGKTIEKGTAAYSRRVNALVHLLVEEVRSVYDRAKENDVDAFEIIRQAGWYRNMRARLRDEFGGAGDLLADLLGATSPNTPVKDNWANAIDIVRRLTRGDWDELIPQWEAYDKEFAKARVALKEFVDARLAEGMTQKAIKELPEYQALLADRKEKGTLPKELLPRKENGSLYNFNSGNAVRAILDHWREVKDAQDILGEGATAPKALTFSGNLIGFRDRATIDVWAARLLQRLAGKPRIPSRAETGVTGDMLSTGETTLQFGMGQDVFHKAAEIIRNDPELSSDPTLSRVSDDDLQAVAWFIEKEIWSKNGWTTAEGAGGSFEFEADLEGNPDREGIKKARSILNRATTTPEQKAEAQEFLDAAKDRTSRWLGGLSMQTSSETQGVAHIPSNDEQANAAQQLLLAALESENADRLIAFRANSTFGVYGKDRERSFDLELSTRSGFTPTKLFREMVQIAFDNNQDSMFISRVLKDGETVDYSRHRPGVEVYFKEGKKLEDLGDLLKQIESKGVKFYTLITDARRSTSAISGEDQKVVGIRFQCVPEFDARYGTPAPSGKQWSELSEEEIINEVKRKELEFINLATEVGSIEGVTLAKQYWYATTAIFNNEYEGILNDQNQNDNAGSSQGSVQTSNRERDGSGVVGNAAASSADHVGRTASASRQAQEESSGALALPYAKPESLNRGTSIKEAIKRSVGDELHQGSAGSRGSYSKNANRITLTPNSDLSTFAHEMGHWYLDALFALYNHKGVSPTIREDVETMLKEFGLKSIDEWFALSRKEREVLHERFAFYVEKYLAEGVAPTRQTRGFFSRLGKWICDVYKQFSDDPQSELDKHYEERFGVQLPQMSEEVRRVLDRMVASEQQIKTAQAAEGLQPLFETKPEDMSDEQWAEYLAYMDEAESEAIDAYLERVARDERWYADAKSRVLKQIQEEAKEVRQQVRERIEKQVDESPIAKIAEALKQSDIRLYEQDLVSQGFSEKQINVLRKHGLLVKSNEENRGKYQASTIATVRQWASFAKRYSNNREFVLDLVKICQREKLIEDLTTKQCLKDHSELFNEKARAAYAAELLHNESRGRMLATELSYLANDKTNSRVVREAAKIAAERMIAKEKVGKVTVKRYLAAEARAARKAYECLKNGDRHGAVVAKRAQLVNHEAALLAIEAEKRVKRISALKARIFKSDSKIAKTHDVGILSIARHIMTMMGIGRVSPSEYRNDDADKYLEKLRKYDEDKYNAFVSIIDKYGYRGDVVFADLPYETAMELLDDVQSLYRMAREAKQLLLEGRKLDREKVVDELLDTFNSVPRDNFDGGKESAIPESRKAAWHLMSIKAQLMRVENWCRAMDRGSNGPFFRYIFAPVANSAAMFRNANIKMQEALLNIVKPMQEKWASVRDIAAPEINYTFTTKAELIGALLHTGNQSNKNKMLLGGRGEDHPWATMRELPDGTTYVDTTNWDAFVNRCIDQGIITKEDMDAVQAIWDLTESTKEVAQKAFMALYGHYFEEVEATPIVTKWGTYRGGYVPAITEKYMVPERKTYEELERVTEQEFVSQMPVHEPGFSKSRVPNYTKPLALDVGLICGHVQQVLKFAFIAPVAHEVAKILNDKRFREAIDKHNSSWIPDMLQPWLKRSYTQSVSDGKTGIVSKTFNKFRSIAGMNIMIGHFVNALQQATGLSVAASKVDAKYLARACSKLMNRDGIIENMIAASPYMKARLDDRAMEFQSEIEKIVSKAATFAQAKTFVDKLAAIDAKMDPARDLLFRKGYLLQTAMQAPIDAIVWTAAYEQAIDNGLSYKDAVNEADSVVRTTQSDFSPENLARVETGSAFLRAFLVFYNYFGMQLNLLGEKWEGAKYTRKYGQFAYDAMLIVSIPSILSAVIAQMFMGFDTGDDDEWDVYDALRLLIAEPVKNVIAMVPWFGGAINTGGAMAAKHGEPMAQFIWGADPYQSKLLGSPSADMFTNSMKAMSQLYKAGIAGEEVNARSTVRNTIDLISVMTRMPLGFLKKPLGYIAAVENREERPRDAIEYARGLVTGRGQD